ncbi:hypothetical protein [Massilia sp. TN1-12]|uniref:hypothetical protein n=1 Tax=Massilia paldalensis TaxID=3377675 RepID=UPI00384D2C37
MAAIIRHFANARQAVRALRICKISARWPQLPHLPAFFAENKLNRFERAREFFCEFSNRGQSRGQSPVFGNIT